MTVMANRLTKIYTRTGDAGTTGKADGSRIAKDDLLVTAIGDIDELNSLVAVVKCTAPPEYLQPLQSIQNDLFNVGGELALDDNTIELLDSARIEQLESWIDTMNKTLEPLKEFILPGGGVCGSTCHVARSVCRRAERSLVTLNNRQPIREALLAYINRLSDYFFVLARSINRLQGHAETYWTKDQ
jgi:cob(I)alamin adenosyltransferase